VIGTDLATGKIGSEATYKVCVSKKTMSSRMIYMTNARYDKHSVR